tara:strand:+ start:5775 stop:6068 length:294 start_codon:yes stop_codon:yes gene_type:complete
MIWWSIFVLSVLLNILFVWYTRIMLSKFSFLGENIDDLTNRIQQYQQHITKVSEMDVYIGDPTIIGLMQHTKDLQEFLTEYQDVFLLEEEQNEEEEA